MTPTEFARLMRYYKASQLDRFHSARKAKSKRTTRGQAKHVNVPLKNSRVHATNVDKLRWSAFSYKALNPDSNLITQAS